jgi:lipoprotein NlpI
MRLARCVFENAAAASATMAVAVLLAATPATQDSVQSIFNRAVDDFEAGRFVQSAAGFDRVASQAPKDAAQLWQRGIALYYAGRFDDCRQQFELHRTVNPDDVENAAWHFLCVARAAGAEKARSALLPVGPDPRVPMRQVYQMLQGNLTPEAVLKSAGNDPSAQFYARLYLGLYADVQGRKDDALEHIKTAASDRFSAVGGYMHLVARVHLKTLQPK